ncbi:uncharacterized protein LOC143198272 [Rhynchophorus ferrugineus]|uniref:uncharacterized protein LOC143198272 n=1 Tax=Rhynchophorus ferrugineus TaxID=354439 RepID=UPI003FCDC480
MISIQVKTEIDVNEVIKIEPNTIQSFPAGHLTVFPRKINEERTKLQCLSNQDQMNERIHCYACDKTFKNKVAYALHSIEYSGDNQYSCHLCDYKNASKYHIELHVRTHEGTTKDKGLKYHNMNYHGSGRVENSVHCDMETHRWIYTDFKPLASESCQEQPKKHVKMVQKRKARVHTGGKQFTCKHCGK